MAPMASVIPAQPIAHLFSHTQKMPHIFLLPLL
jgi:hypothetical protein